MNDIQNDGIIIVNDNNQNDGIIIVNDEIIIVNDYYHLLL